MSFNTHPPPLARWSACGGARSAQGIKGQLVTFFGVFRSRLRAGLCWEIGIPCALFCLCVYVFACVSACVCLRAVCVYDHVHVRLHVRVNVCVNVYVHVCAHVRLRLCVHVRVRMYCLRI